MRNILKLGILAAVPLLMASMWMDKQPSYKPYEEPILSAPVGSVSITGQETVSWNTDLKNPLLPDHASLEHGKTLFTINCVLCHGETSAELGPVGKKLKPPPPSLHQEQMRNRNNAHIFKVITLGFGRMPPFKNKLTWSERWELVNYLRTRS